MEIVNKTKNTILAHQVEIADTFLKRMRGLLNSKEFKKGRALVIKPCCSIHTFFMPFPIDVVFLNKQNRAIKTIACLKPWRLSGIYFSSHLCLELPVGTIESSQTLPGDILTFIP